MLSKAQILDHVWNYDFNGEANVVESYISYLRRKVDTTEPRLLHTIRGVGYTLRLPRGSVTAGTGTRAPRPATPAVRAVPLRITLVALLVGPGGPRPAGDRFRRRRRCCAATWSSQQRRRAAARSAAQGPNAGSLAGLPAGRLPRDARRGPTAPACRRTAGDGRRRPRRPRRAADVPDLGEHRREPSVRGGGARSPVGRRRTAATDWRVVAARPAAAGTRSSSAPTSAGDQATPSAGWSRIQVRRRAHRADRARRRRLPAGAQQPAPAGRGGAHRARRSPPATCPSACPRATSAPRSAGCPPRSTACSARIESAFRAQQESEDAGPRLRGPDAPLRRRRQPRAADAADLDPRVRRAVPAGCGAADRRRRPPADGADRVRGRPHGRCSSRTCCCSPAWTSSGPLAVAPVDLAERRRRRRPRRPRGAARPADRACTWTTR